MPGYKFFAYINNHLASRTIKTENSSGIEILTIEITSITSFETIVSKLSNKYEKLVLMEDYR